MKAVAAQITTLGNNHSSLSLYPLSWPWQVDGLPQYVHASLDRMEAWKPDDLLDHHAVQHMFSESWEATQEEAVRSNVQPWACSAQRGAGALFMDDLLAAGQLPTLEPEMASAYSMLLVERTGTANIPLNVGKHEHQTPSVLRPHGTPCNVPKPATPTTNDKVRHL